VLRPVCCNANNPDSAVIQGPTMSGRSNGRGGRGGGCGGRVLTLELYVMLTLQYFLIFLQQDDNDSQRQLHPMTVYSTILLLAAAAYLYQTSVLLELMHSTAATSSPCWILFCQLVPEILIVTSMALTICIGAEWGCLLLVAGTGGLASTVVVFHALQLMFGTTTSSSSNNSEYHKTIDDDEGESMV